MSLFDKMVCPVGHLDKALGRSLAFLTRIFLDRCRCPIECKLSYELRKEEKLCVITCSAVVLDTDWSMGTCSRSHH